MNDGKLEKVSQAAWVEQSQELKFGFIKNFKSLVSPTPSEKS